MSKYSFIVVHHTARSNSTVESIRKHHKSKGWSDIGYHCVIDKKGIVYAGRDESKRGAHAANPARPNSEISQLMSRGGTANAYSLGVVLVGNYQVETPPSVQIAGLVAKLTQWCLVYHIDPGHIYGHRDLSTPKRCPGDHVYNLLPRIRQRVQSALIGRYTPY